jgi:hypothetical protein
MNFLQISYGPQIKHRMKHVQSVLRQLQDSDTYTLIADENRVKDDRVNWIPASEYEQRLMDEHEVIRRIFEDNKKKGNRIRFAERADIIRVHYASEHEDVLYCDTDILMHDPLPEQINKIGKRYFLTNLRSVQQVHDTEDTVCYGCRAISSHLDDGLFFNGKHADFFQKFFQWMLQQERLRRKQVFGWYAHYIRQPQSRKTLVTGFYTHCYGA